MPHWTELVDPDAPEGAYLPWKKVEPRVGISRTTAWRLQKTGDFPKPYVMSARRVAYRESEVEAWKASRGHRAAEPVRQRAPTSAHQNCEPSPVLPERPSWTPQEAAPLTREVDAPLVRPPAAGPRRGAVKPKTRRGPQDQMTFDF